jgi:hypothetical protein
MYFMLTATGHRHNIYERKEALENGLMYVKYAWILGKSVTNLCSSLY